MESGNISLKCPLPCCEIGKLITVVTADGYQFFADITYIDDCCKTLRFDHPTDTTVTGFDPAYSIQNKDVALIRCKSCCDDNFYEIEELADVSELDDGIIGHIYVYIGDPDDPRYVWKWTGQGSYKNPAKYILIERPVYNPYDEDSFEMEEM